MSEQPRPGAPTPSLDPASLDLLHVVCEGLIRVVGFGAALITVVDGDELVVVAVSGDVESVDATGRPRSVQSLLHTRYPLEVVSEALATAESWGAFKLVPHTSGMLARLTDWVPVGEPSHEPGGWQPGDLLAAPIHDAEGTLRGLISLGAPADRRRPGPAKRRLMNKHATQAGQAVLTALERGALAQRVRILEAARATIRTISASLDLDALLGETHEALRSGFSADALWIHTNAPETGDAAVADEQLVAPRFRPDLVELMEQSARHYWELQQVDVATPDTLRVDPRFGTDGEGLATLCEENGIGPVLFVPLGAGPTCLGCLVLVRSAGRPLWSAAEQEVALGLGHDLGRAIDNARSYGRERRLVEELQELASYRSRVISTLSTELSTPIVQMLDAVHRLSDALRGPGDAERPEVAAASRSAQRMVRIVDDLTLLAQVGNPHTPLRRRPVDLVALTERVLELTRTGAEERGLTVVVERPGGPVVAAADSSELEQVVENLLSNAVKYTPRRGRVTVTLAAPPDEDEVVLQVTDTGVGIAAEDHGRLFEAFYRSRSPAARSVAGTGLGLAIVERIVDRHRGRVEVESTLGAGSTFRVRLPRAAAGEVAQ